MSLLGALKRIDAERIDKLKRSAEMAEEAEQATHQRYGSSVIVSPPIPTSVPINIDPPAVDPFARRIVTFDTETTSLNPHRERVIDVALVEVIDGVPTGRTFSSLIRSLHPVNPEATMVHGLRISDLVDAPTWGEKLAEMLAFIDGAPVCAHNAKFDAAFWRAECYRVLAQAGRVAPLVPVEPGGGVFAPDLPDSSVIDMIDPKSPNFVPIEFECSLQFYKSHFTGAASLNAMSKRFGIDVSDRVGPGAHGALKDSYFLAANILPLRRAQLSFGLGGSGPAASYGEQQLKFERPIRPARNFPIPASEIAAHRDCLSKIKSPIWLSNPEFSRLLASEEPKSIVNEAVDDGAPSLFI